MLALQRGKRAALDQLYARYSQRLLVYFFRMLGQDEAKAQDFLHDLFLKLIEKPHLYSSAYPFRSWIFSIAANMCKNEYRRQALRRQAPPDLLDDGLLFGSTADDFLERQFDHGQFEQALLQELAGLDPDKRNTFLLRFQEQFSIKEISEILQCAEGTVKSRLFYTTRYLAERLRAYHPNDHEVSYHDANR